MASAIGLETEEGQRTKGVWLRNVDIPRIFIDQSGYGFMSTCDQLTSMWRCISFLSFFIKKLSFTVKCTIFGFCMSSMINIFMLALLQANAFWLTQKRKRKQWKPPRLGNIPKAQESFFFFFFNWLYPFFFWDVWSFFGVAFCVVPNLNCPVVWKLSILEMKNSMWLLSSVDDFFFFLLGFL